MSLYSKKCRKILVGKKDQFCSNYFLMDRKWKWTNILETCSQKNMKNVGYKATTSKIINILKNVNVGHYYFTVAVMLRQAILISSMLLNSEASFKLTGENIGVLEPVDENLGAPKSTPRPSLFLETYFSTTSSTNPKILLLIKI